MSYIYVLERIEDGRLTVEKAIKEIEKESRKRQKQRAKKIKLIIIDEGKRLYLPGISLGFIKVFFKLCAPFIKIDQDEVREKFSKEDLDVVLTHLEDILKLMKDYPPLDLINVQSKDTTVKIMTK